MQPSVGSLFLLCRGDQIHIGFIGHIFQPMGDFGPEAFGDGDAHDHHVFEDGCTFVHNINNPKKLHETFSGVAGSPASEMRDSQLTSIENGMIVPLISICSRFGPGMKNPSGGVKETVLPEIVQSALYVSAVYLPRT